MNINSPIIELFVLIKQCLIYSYDLQLFQKSSRGKSRRLLSQKVVGTEKVYILSLEDLLRVVFIDEERRNLKVVTAGGELTRNINH